MTEKEQGGGFFYGWIIVAIATLALLVSNGLAIYGMPVFSEWIRNDLIASGAIPAEHAQAIVSNFGVITFFVAGLSAPFAGYFIQKFNTKSLMLIGCVILGGGFLIHSQATSLETIYFVRVLFGISLGFVGVLINTVLVSNWFRKNRGTALGIVLTGTSIGGIVIPLIATPLILKYNWRIAMIALSFIVWVVLIPAIIWLVKTKPSDIGLFPDGDKNETEEILAIGKDQTGFTLFEAMKTPLFWVFALCAALIFYPLFVSTQQLILYIRTPKIGVSPETAGLIQASLAFLSIGGKFLFGFMSDKISPTRVMLICCLVMFLATLVLLNFTSATVLLFVIPFGFGYGGTFVLLQRLVSDYFGSKDFPKILGAITVIETIGASIGGKITGAVADADGGDYTRAFYYLIAATGIALILTIALNFMVKEKNREIVIS
jgi:MFS family permease